MKLMILGHARHGKDTVADIIAKHYGLSHKSSSMWAARKVMMPAFEKEKGLIYHNALQCFEDRGNHRSFWYDKITAYCRDAKDLTRTTREIFEEVDMYVGCRDSAQLHQARCVGLFTYAIWVDRSRVHSAEPASSNTIEPWMCDYVIDNNGTLEQLEVNVKQLMDYFVRGYLYSGS